MENPIKIDDLEVPLFLGNIQIYPLESILTKGRPHLGF